jgi:hypothetical protein
MGTWSASAKNHMIDALLKGSAITFAGVVYAKLHTGDPGSAGTSNAAGETTRQAVTLGAASGGVGTSTADVTWASVSTTETISWVSFWDASSAGLFIGKDDLPSSKSVTAGDTLTIASGNITFAIND